MIFLPEYSGLSKDFTISTCFFDLLLSVSMNTSISTLSTFTISTTMTIATIAPMGSPEPTGSKEGERNELGREVASVENCASVCRISTVCGVPVCVIMRSGGCTVEVVARALSGRELGKVEGEGVREGDGVCEGNGVNTATEAVMIGAAVVDERKS